MALNENQNRQKNSQSENSQPDTSLRSLQHIFGELWRDYTEFNPQAKKIYQAILAREQQLDPGVQELVNDHVALRTFNVPRIGLDALSGHFTKLGYQARGEYVFETKKLFARHFEHPEPSLPKVFISELKVELCSPLIQTVAEACAEAVPDSILAGPELLWSRRSWSAKHETYLELLEESEYAAWLYAFGFRSNHFTISLNHLKSFSELSDLNAFVREQGYALNTSGGVIKGTPAELLEQSATLAESALVEFEDGKISIPSCYYEFAKRYPVAGGKDGELYQGFIAASADKIFESTDVKAAKK